MNCLTEKFIVGEFKYDSDGLTYPIVYPTYFSKESDTKHQFRKTARFVGLKSGA